MLNFWYSDRCTRQIKLFFCISTCILIYIASSKVQLPPLLVVVSLSIGILIHITHNLKSKIHNQNHYYTVQNYTLSLIPILSFTGLIYFLKLKSNSEMMLLLAIQCVGFTALGLFIVSIYQNRNPRFEQEHDSSK